MNKKSKYIIIVILCIVIAIGTYIMFFSPRSEKTTAQTQNFISSQVIRGDIKVTASGSSNVQVSTKKEIKSLDSSGVVDAIFVNEGDLVQEGDILLTFENSDTNTEIDNLKLELSQEESELAELEDSTEELKIYATQSGYTGDITARIGDELSSGYTITTISDKSKVEISGFFHKKSVESISVGDKATITVPEYLIEVEGVVSRINTTPIPKDGGAVLYEVIVEVENPGGFTENISGNVVINNAQGTFTSIENANFSTIPPEEVKLKVGGKLIKLYISSGKYVEEGTLIAEIESSSIEKSIENQIIALEKKRNELAEKIKDLYDTAIYAPISGVITQVDVTEGERVSSNATLMVISDLNNLEVIIPVDELDINNIELGKEATVKAEAVPGVSFNAIVSNIALEGDVDNGVSTFDVTLSLKETNRLKPGMSVNAEIIIESRENTLLLPVEAIQYKRDEKFVLVKKNDSDNETESIPVEIGLVSEDYVEIAEGLNEGDVVVYQSTATNSQGQQTPRIGTLGIGAPAGGSFPNNNGQIRTRPSGGGN